MTPTLALPRSKLQGREPDSPPYVVTGTRLGKGVVPHYLIKLATLIREGTPGRRVVVWLLAFAGMTGLPPYGPPAAAGGRG